MSRRMAWAASLALALASGACGRGETGSEMAKSAPGSSANTVVVPADSPQLQQIKVEAVQIAEVASEELVAPARVIANPNRTARVLSPVQGRVTGVLVRLGDRVEQGQPVVTIEGAEAARQQASRKLELLGLRSDAFRQAALVRAPISGKVLEINVAPGEYRAAVSFS